MKAMRGHRELFLSACLAIIVPIMLYAVSAPAAGRDEDRDPFYSEGPRAATSIKPASDGSWGRDPFTRPFEGASAVPSSRQRSSRRNISGIICGKDMRLAIIGGETVKEGGMSGDQKVAEIRPQSIVFMNGNGSTEEVFLESFSVRQ